MNLAVRLFTFFFIMFFLANCASAPESGKDMPGASIVQVTDPAPTPYVFSTTVSPTLTPAPISVWLPTPSSIPQAEICSPLEGIDRTQLLDMIHNPFQPPSEGLDDPHQGVDFADLQGPNRIAVTGRPVTAVFSGRIAMVTVDRFPYGNAVLVETPVGNLPAAWLEALDLPKTLSQHANRSALTCPDQLDPPGDLSNPSLYLLYAHMLFPPDQQTGQTVSCGEVLGAIGNSGNALNPHLHLEVRLGPANANFASMAHYDTSATPLEITAYCTWRISGYFRLIDPMRLLSLP